MYIYGFTTFAGHDRIQKIDTAPYKEGDLVKYGDDIFLAVGNQVSFFEQYEMKRYIPKQSLEVVYKKILSVQTLELLHRMVYYWYTTYKSVIRYFLPEDMVGVLQQEISSKKKKESHIQQIAIKSPLYESIQLVPEQNLIIFPDLRTLYNLVPEEVLQDEGVAVLNAQQSNKQQAINRWKIKKGQVRVILCTHAELFQDYHELKKIVLIEPSKWYYANQQDPRYKVKTIVKKMGEIYAAQTETRGE